MAKKTNKKKKLNFIKPVLIIAVILTAIFSFIWYKNYSSNKLELEFDLSKVKIDKPSEGNNIIYTSTDELGNINYNLVNLETGKKSNLFNSSMGMNLESIYFSPKSNYILQFNKEHIGKDVNNPNMAISINIYDPHFRNPITIYNNTTSYFVDEQLQAPQGEVISPSGNKIILWTRDAEYENEENPDENGNMGLLERFLVKVYLLDLSKKSIKLIAEGDLDSPTVLGWVNDDEPIIHAGTNPTTVGIYDLKNNKNKVFEITKDYLTIPITDNKSLISYFTGEPLAETMNRSVVVVKDIITGKEVAKVDADRIGEFDFHPVMFSPDSKQLLLAEKFGEFKPEARNYYLLNISDNSLELVNDPKDLIAKWNKEKYGKSWAAGCVDGMNFVEVENKVIDSQKTTVFGCGQFDLVNPKLFISK